MAYLPSYNDILSYLRGEQQQGPVTVSSVGPSPTPATAQSTGEAPATQQPAARVVSAPTTQEANIAAQPGAVKTAETLLSPIQTGVGEQKQALQETVKQFEEQAGPSRTFENVGGAQTLQQAYQSPTASPDYGAKMAAARDLLATQYKGPMELSAEQVQSIQAATQQLEEKAQALQTGQGIQTLLHEQAPQLTPGMLRYQAQQVSLTPGFREARLAQVSDINQYWKDLSTQQQQALERATERTSEEQAIREAGQGYLGTQRADIVGDINEQVAQKEAEKKALEDAWNRFQDTGSYKDLKAIPQWARASYTPEGAVPWQQPIQWNPEQFNTEARKNLAQAEQTYNKIMNTEYSSIKDIPLLNVRVDGQGRETWDFTQKDKDGKVIVNEKGSQLTPEQRALVIKRQERLQGAGFSPGSQREQAAASTGSGTAGLARPFAGMIAQTKEGKPASAYGKYATVMPMYFAQGGPEGSKWQPADYRFYLSYIPGESPSRENVSTEQQRLYYNNIQDLLGELDRIQETSPFQAAQVAAKVEEFLDDEKKVLDERKTQLSGSAEEWKKLVDKARKKYKKAKASSVWGTITRIAMGAATLGGSELVRAAPDILPGDLGKAAQTFGQIAMAPIAVGAAGAMLPMAAGFMGPETQALTLGLGAAGASGALGETFEPGTIYEGIKQGYTGKEPKIGGQKEEKKELISKTKE